MSAKILNAQGIHSSEVPTGNLLWVDKINGIDALAKRGRMTIPFKTLKQAKDAAISGDTIVVLPGTYNEAGLAKDGVNWFLHAGVTIASTANAHVFDDGGVQMRYDVDGCGVIGSSGTNVEVFRITHSGTRICIRCREINGTLSPGYSLVRVQNGDVQLECERMKTTAYGRAISISDGQLVARVGNMSTIDEEAVSQNGGSLHLFCQHMTTDTASGIRCSGGTCDADVTVIASALYHCLEVNGGLVRCTAQRIGSDTISAIYMSGGECDVRAHLIEAPGTVVEVYGTYTICRVFGARIAGNIPVFVQSYYVALNNCWLMGSSYSIDADPGLPFSPVCLACGANVAPSASAAPVPIEQLKVDGVYF